MTNGADTFTITIRKRSWWSWALAGIWLLLEVLLVQTALAGVGEGEARAATISCIAAIVLAAAGFLAWLRPGRSARQARSSGQPGNAPPSVEHQAAKLNL